MREKQRPIYMEWVNPLTSVRIPAGVAFHNGDYGELKLYLSHEQNHRSKPNPYFLKPVLITEDKTVYRMEAARITPGGNFVRTEVGKGIQNQDTEAEIVVEFGPSVKQLIVKTTDQQAHSKQNDVA